MGPLQPQNPTSGDILIAKQGNDCELQSSGYVVLPLSSYPVGRSLWRGFLNVTRVPGADLSANYDFRELKAYIYRDMFPGLNTLFRWYKHHLFIFPSF